MSCNMKKSEANQLIELISDFRSEGLEVTQGMQSSMNNFVDGYLKHNPKTNISKLQKEFDKKSSNLIKSLQQAFRVKKLEIIRKIQSEGEAKPLIKEKEFIINDACDELGMTSQNLNALIRKYNIPHRKESARKKYITESTIEMIRNGDYK